MAKRALDLLLSALVLIAAAPLLAAAMLAIWAYDGHSPLYCGVRVGRGGRDFRMVKLRSMRADAERRGAASTAASDWRITPPGRILRQTKIDELPQFWNVLIGDMSIVGPRPNTRRGGVDAYTREELRLLSVRPGITDLASIVFADEGDILDGSDDPDRLYDAIIRPWKSRLGLLYVDRRSLATDLAIVALTAVAVVRRSSALNGVAAILARWGASEELGRISRRRARPPCGPPPTGADLSLLPCTAEDVDEGLLSSSASMTARKKPLSHPSAAHGKGPGSADLGACGPAAGGMTMLFYCLDGNGRPSAVPLPEGVTVGVWSPSREGLPRIDRYFGRNLAWSALSGIGVFGVADLTEISLWRDGQMIHRLIVTPRWYRFPFMRPGDLQLGDLWTDPALRGQGLARAAVGEACRRFAGRSPRLWYLTETGNMPSRRLADACGFHLAGVGERTDPLGLRLAGRFLIRRPL